MVVCWNSASANAMMKLLLKLFSHASLHRWSCCGRCQSCFVVPRDL